MVGRIRGVISVVAAASCALGCVTWRPVGERNTTEVTRQQGQFEPLDELTVTAAVGGGGELLLEIGRMCSARETAKVRHEVTERAGVTRTSVALAVGGFLAAVVGGAAGTLQGSAGSAAAGGGAGAVLIAPLIYGIVRRGDTRSRELDATETRDVRAECENSGFGEGAKVAVMTPWGAALSAELSDEGMVVLAPAWDASKLSAGATWRIDIEGSSAEWKPDDATVERMVAAKKKRPAGKKPKRR